MLKSTISNNSPGHSHNEHTFEVGLSSDICPGNISKRKNKMKIDRLTLKQVEKCLEDVKNLLECEEMNIKHHFPEVDATRQSNLRKHGNYAIIERVRNKLYSIEDQVLSHIQNEPVN